ncbi:MAG: fatty acid/phospholipid synthesis protein PlsX [Myxococcales bacterium]|nr:fatty acid/phospholipid synthesis protein PlsX [Myxococcales bacterium]
MKVVVDAMGSDGAPGPEVAGALRSVRAHAISVVLVGDARRLETELSRAGRADADRIEVVHASEVVTTHDHPGQAFRAKPNSSMRVAVTLVADGKGDAVVSAGNSGAMLACSLFVLGRLPGIERPAIVTVLPTPSGPLVLCDAGGNTEPKASQLAQFGVLAAAYDRVVHGRGRPRLGLLSNGAEPGKGTPLTREAHALLSAATGNFQYVGYVEGSDLFRGVVDVVATDGFTGNIVLKSCEGIAEGMFGLVRQELEKTAIARLGSALVAPALRGLAKRIDYTEIGGALLAGVTRPAVIAHGRSDANAIASAIRAAHQFAERSLPGQLAAAISALG